DIPCAIKIVEQFGGRQIVQVSSIAAEQLQASQRDVVVGLAVLLVEIETELAVRHTIDYHRRDVSQGDRMGEDASLVVERRRTSVSIEALLRSRRLQAQERLDQSRSRCSDVRSSEDQGAVCRGNWHRRVIGLAAVRPAQRTRVVEVDGVDDMVV